MKLNVFSGKNSRTPGCHPLFPFDSGPLALPAKVWHYGLLSFAAGLILLLLFSYDLPFLTQNLSGATEFFPSFPFLFFCLSGIGLASGRLSNRWYECSVFILAAVYLFVLYGDYLLLLHMSGDSICQVAYWNILFRPHLLGSIGVAFAKPGQVVLLGLLYQMSLIGGHLVFKLGLCLIMAACVWSLVGVATDFGGRLAGILAFFLSLWAFQEEFVFSESTIYAITALFTGLRLYYYHPRLKGLGRCLLVLTLQFRIEAVAVLGVIWLMTLFKKDWRELITFSAWALISLLVFVGIILQIQGSLSRLNSGAAVGYVGPVLGNGAGDPAFSNNKIDYIAGIIRTEFSGTYYIRFLFILAILGIAGACCFNRKLYLTVFASMIIITVNVFLLNGTFNLVRYCDLIYAFSCSIGAAALVRYGHYALQRRTPLRLGVLALGGFVLLAAFDFSRLNTYKHLDPANTSVFLASAMALMEDEKIPFSARLLTEDDLLSHIVVVAPDRYQSLASLQYFNVASDAERQKILAKTDYIWLDLHGFPYFYLFHLALPEWGADPFRLMIRKILAEGNQPRSLYGFQFIPLDLDANRLLLKVAH